VRAQAMRLMGLSFQQFYHYADISRLVKLYVSHTQQHLEYAPITYKITLLEIPKSFVNQSRSCTVRELQKFQSSLQVNYQLFLTTEC